MHRTNTLMKGSSTTPLLAHKCRCPGSPASVDASQFPRVEDAVPRLSRANPALKRFVGTLGRQYQAIIPTLVCQLHARKRLADTRRQRRTQPRTHSSLVWLKAPEFRHFHETAATLGTACEWPLSDTIPFLAHEPLLLTHCPFPLPPLVIFILTCSALSACFGCSPMVAMRSASTRALANTARWPPAKCQSSAPMRCPHGPHARRPCHLSTTTSPTEATRFAEVSTLGINQRGREIGRDFVGGCPCRDGMVLGGGRRGE